MAREDWHRFPQDNITIHEEKRLRESKHQKPRTQEEKEAALKKTQDVARGPSSAPGGSSAGGHSLQRQPSWAKKLLGKVKKTFCFLQDREYQAYVDQRHNVQRQKAIMAALNIPCSPVSSSITAPKEDWVRNNCNWSEDESEEEVTGPHESSHPSPSHGWDV